MRQESEGGSTDRRIGGWWTRARSAVRSVVGAPDYEAYLEHCRRAGHPPRLSERDYVTQFFESKGKGVRCC